MGQTPDTVACPVCNDSAVRVFSAPMVSTAPREIVAAIDRAERSGHEPEVVTAVPPRDPRKRTPSAPPNPAFRRLPKP
jgi:hypothetical protein